MFADHCSLVWCNKEQIAGHDLVEVFLLIPELYFSITCIAQQLHNRQESVLWAASLCQCETSDTCLCLNPLLFPLAGFPAWLSGCFHSSSPSSAFLKTEGLWDFCVLLAVFWAPVILTQHSGVPLICHRPCGCCQRWPCSSLGLSLGTFLAPLHPWCTTAVGDHYKH